LHHPLVDVEKPLKVRLETTALTAAELKLVTTMTDVTRQIDSPRAIPTTTAVAQPAQALGLDAAAVQGSWRVLAHSEVLAVHAVLLSTGKVLFAAGSGNSAVRFKDPNFGKTALKFWTSVVWDPTVNPPHGQDTEQWAVVRPMPTAAGTPA
jgi:hypothetical protein